MAAEKTDSILSFLQDGLAKVPLYYSSGAKLYVANYFHGKDILRDGDSFYRFAFFTFCFNSFADFLTKKLLKAQGKQSQYSENIASRIRDNKKEVEKAFNDIRNGRATDYRNVRDNSVTLRHPQEIKPGELSQAGKQKLHHLQERFIINGLRIIFDTLLLLRNSFPDRSFNANNLRFHQEPFCDFLAALYQLIQASNTGSLTQALNTTAGWVPLIEECLNKISDNNPTRKVNQIINKYEHKPLKADARKAKDEQQEYPSLQAVSANSSKPSIPQPKKPSYAEVAMKMTYEQQQPPFTPSTPLPIPMPPQSPGKFEVVEQHGRLLFNFNTGSGSSTSSTPAISPFGSPNGGK